VLTIAKALLSISFEKTFPEAGGADMVIRECVLSAVSTSFAQ
jgi:hypothetical protein